MDAGGSSRTEWAILSCASWDCTWPVALREAAESKRLLRGDQGDRAESPEPFCDGVLTAVVGRVGFSRLCMW